MQLVSTTCSGVSGYGRRHEIVRKDRIWHIWVGEDQRGGKNPINIPSLSKHHISKLFVYGTKQYTSRNQRYLESTVESCQATLQALKKKKKKPHNYRSNLSLLYVGLVFSLALEEAWKIPRESFWGLTLDTNMKQFIFILSCNNLLFSLFCLFI